MDSDSWAITGMIAFAIAVGSLFLWAAMTEQKQWDQFAIEHHCVVTAHEQGGSAYVMGMNGKGGVAFLPDKTTFKCDDGQTYTRAN